MRRVLITGGTGRIGSELVIQMLNDGCEVVFTSRSQEKAEAFIAEKELDSSKCFAMEADFHKMESLKEWANGISHNIDAVIHNARSLDYLKPDERGRVSAEQMQQEYYMAVTMPYLLTYALMDAGKPIKDVLFMSSMYGVVAPTPSLYDDFQTQSPVHYGLTKAAQIHLTKELAVRLRDSHTRVNCISYGGVQGRVDEDFLKRYQSLNPTGRMLADGDLYPPVQFILNNPELAINGENIKVDGGWTIW